MPERRIINRKETPDVSNENITIKDKPVLTLEQKIAQLEAYINSADPFIRIAGEIPDLKKQLAILNDEITRIAGIQSRTNSYLDTKIGEIDKTFSIVISVVNKLDTEFKSLISDIDEPMETPQEMDLFEDEAPKENSPKK